MRRNDVRDTRFWRKAEPHHDVFENVRRIRNRTSLRREMDLYHACLYDDSELTGLGTTTNVNYEPSLLAFNVVRQAVDTLTAKIAKNQPLPTPLTTGGNWHQKRRAKKFGKAIQGTFDGAGVWRTSPTVARDCSLFGTGIAHNYRVGKTIYHERVFPWEIFIDPREAMYAKPRTIYMVRWVDRFVLADRFPEFEEQIIVAPLETTDAFDFGYDQSCDLVMVVEAWHLPSRVLEKDDKDEDKSGEPLHDGCHVIAIGNATLLKEPWRRQYFPFSVLRMSDPLVGWFGTGLAKQLTGLQYTINDTASVIQEAFALSGGYIAIEAGSKVDPDKLVNGRGSILEYSGQKPEWLNPQPIHPDHWNFVQSLIPKAFEMTGVSQLSAQSQKPAGLESAVALTTFNDFETERFAMFAEQYEQYHIDIAWQQFDLLEEIYEEYGDLRVRTSTRERGQRILEDLEWEKIRLDRDAFTLQVWSTSLLSKKPAAKLEMVQQMINGGWINQEEGRDLLELPDLERSTSLQQASRRIIEECIERILDAEDPYAPGVYTYPEPSFNLKLCVLLGAQLYLDAKLDGAPDENLQMVLQFISDAKAEIDRANQKDTAGTPVPPGTDALPPEAGAAPPLPPPPMPGGPPPGPDAMPPMPPEMMAPDMGAGQQPQLA